MRLTRRYRFSASHRLHSEQFTAEENAELFGKCNNPYGHGHNYFLEVTVEGSIDPATGQVVPIGQLDAYVQQRVVEPFDHRFLNTEVSEFSALVPTTENLANVAVARLQDGWPQTFPRLSLRRVHIQETERNRFETTLP